MGGTVIRPYLKNITATATNARSHSDVALDEGGSDQHPVAPAGINQNTELEATPLSVVVVDADSSVYGFGDARARELPCVS